MSENNPRQQFIALLTAEVEVMRQLYEIMQEENTVLRERDPVAIDKIVAKKLDKLQAFELQAKHRDDFLARLNLPSAKSGIEQCLAKFAKNDELLRNLWSELQEITRGCKRENDKNASVTEFGCRSVEEALDILCGQNDEGDKLYGPKGGSEKKARSRMSYKI